MARLVDLFKVLPDCFNFYIDFFVLRDLNFFLIRKWQKLDSSCGSSILKV